MTADQNIHNVLKSEASGILNRMIGGLVDLNTHNGFTVIEGHADLIEEYKSSSNTIAEFLNEYFTFDYDAPKIPVAALLTLYKSFANDRFSESLTPQKFSNMMAHHGLTQFDKITPARGTGGKRMWAGLKLHESYEFDDKTGNIIEKF